MTTIPLPPTIANEAKLDDLLSRPSPLLIDFMRRLEGDLLILGIAGKMGITLGQAAVRAIRKAGVQKRVYGVARFSDPDMRRQLDGIGVETIPCDLLDANAMAVLPDAPNVIFMAGRKFGTDGNEGLTWAINTLAPGNVARRYAGSRIVAFSTGCVYPLAPVLSGGCTEEDTPAPVGEYAQSCLGRERIFQYYSNIQGTPTCLIRLNYAIDLRYGVLFDIADTIRRDEPVELTVGHFNCIWQGDACTQALLALEHCAAPANILNVTGPETLSVRAVASALAARMGKTAIFSGEEGPVAYLNNAAKATALFGYPGVPLLPMLDWTAQWIMAGGRSLGKPTHFEVNTGRY